MILFFDSLESTRNFVQLIGVTSRQYYINRKWIAGLLTNFKNFYPAVFTGISRHFRFSEPVVRGEPAGGLQRRRPLRAGHFRFSGLLVRPAAGVLNQSRGAQAPGPGWIDRGRGRFHPDNSQPITRHGGGWGDSRLRTRRSMADVWKRTWDRCPCHGR